MTAEADPVAALILAGGKATRFGGIAKHELTIDGCSIFERQIAVLAPRVGEILVASPAPIAGYRTIADTIPGGGPLSGIAAGLAAATSDWLLVVAGDMPYLDGRVIELLRYKTRDAADAVAIEIGGRPQPLLCALACETVLPVLTELLATGERKASRLLTDAGLVVTWIDEAELRAIDPELRCLANINSPDDLPR